MLCKGAPEGGPVWRCASRPTPRVLRAHRLQVSGRGRLPGSVPADEAAPWRRRGRQLCGRPPPCRASTGVSLENALMRVEARGPRSRLPVRRLATTRTWATVSGPVGGECQVGPQHGDGAQHCSQDCCLGRAWSCGCCLVVGGGTTCEEEQKSGPSKEGVWFAQKITTDDKCQNFSGLYLLKGELVFPLFQTPRAFTSSGSALLPRQ